MPEFQRGNSMAYLNPAPPLDAKASSYYAISPPPRDWDPSAVATFLEEYNRYMLQILTIHEAYPGHYVQPGYCQQEPLADSQGPVLGRLRRGLGSLYGAMMLDEGFGHGDLKLRLITQVCICAVWTPFSTTACTART